MNEEVEQIFKVLPCPFCGCESITFEEGTTFRWRQVVCSGCGAIGPEVRVDTINQDRALALAEADKEALIEWNRRFTV